MKNIVSVVAAAAVLSLAVYALSPESDELQEGEVAQTAIIEVSNSTGYQHDVLYPKKFSSLPRLKVKLIKGSGYLEAVEQHLEGFVFKTSSLGYSETEGAYVEWTAKGFINNKTL
jgi:hypothetical protein